MKRLFFELAFGCCCFATLAPQEQLAAQTQASTQARAIQNTGPNQSPSPIDLSSLDTAFARALKEEHSPGFAVAVVLRDKIIYSKGFGYRDYEHRLPVTPNTLFAIGSCSKSFTASLIGMLREEGKVKLDTPVRIYLPELKFYNDNMNARITLRDMMSHRTGLPRHDASWYYFYTPSRMELLGRIQYQPPTAELREKWQYNNLMFMALGVVEERLTGLTWEENVRKKIFEPLGMQRTTTDFSTWINDPDVALGYSVRDGSVVHREAYKDVSSLNPAGGINSCVNDMAKWVITWINGGWYEGKNILPAAWITEAVTPQMVMPGGLPTKEKPGLFFSNYGFAWMLSSYRGHYRVMHDGQINGFSASTSFFPSDSLGIIVLCNEQSADITAVVRNLIADKMLGLPGYDWQSDLQKLKDKQIAAGRIRKSFAQAMGSMGSPATHPLKEYTGTYENKGYGRIRVELHGDSLYAIEPSATIWLEHFDLDIFKTLDATAGEAIDTTDSGLPHVVFNIHKRRIASLSVQVEPALPPALFTRIADK
jgi:CubicO group peptidase (beta-lactamase class C family)